MEYEDNSQEQETMLQRIKESPRTVSALIIILIVAAAIYAFSGDQTNDPARIAENADQAAEQQEGEEGAMEEEGEMMEKEDDAMENGEAMEKEDNTMTEEKKDASVEGAMEEKQQPSSTKTDEGYIQVAGSGDGYTHLARRATSSYLNENTADFEVTAAHRVYIEDYIQNRLGNSSVEVGQSVTVPMSLIQEAVQASSNLSPAQIDNLQQYTGSLS